MSTADGEPDAYLAFRTFAKLTSRTIHAGATSCVFPDSTHLPNFLTGSSRSTGPSTVTVNPFDGMLKIDSSSDWNSSRDSFRVNDVDTGNGAPPSLLDFRNVFDFQQQEPGSYTNITSASRHRHQRTLRKVSSTLASKGKEFRAWKSKKAMCGEFSSLDAKGDEDLSQLKSVAEGGLSQSADKTEGVEPTNPL